MERRPISELDKTDTDFSEFCYSYDFARERGLLSDFDIEDTERYCKEHPEAESWVKGSRWCPQRIEIQDLDGEIFWWIREESQEEVKEYPTCLGVYRSNDQGEFGGDFYTPGGKRYGGNYCDVFDYKGKVYAVDSCGHMGLCRFHLNCFEKPEDCKTIYSIGYDLEQVLEEELYGKEILIREQLTYRGRYVTKEQAFVMISGYIEEKNKDDSYRHLTRILQIRDESVEIYMELPYIISNITSFVLKDGKLYLGKDKVVEVIDLETEERSFYTFLDQEAMEDLKKNGKYR